MRVPRPPASTTHCIGSRSQKDDRTVVVEAESDLVESDILEPPPQPGGLRAVEEQEPPRTCADELATEGAVFAGQLVPGVNLVVADPGAPLAFQLPVFVHELTEADRIAGLECVSYVIADPPDLVEVVQHRPIKLIGPPFLVSEHLVGFARE